MATEPQSTNRFWTIPNVLTLVRFGMIPVIIWLYMLKEDYFAAAIVMGLSGLTDIADGIIARKFNMITDIGKIIDPIADKLTQATVIFCLAIRYTSMRALFIAHVIKEVAMGIMGIISLKHHEIKGAMWYGKLSTVVLFWVTVIHIIFPVVNETLSVILVSISIAVMAMALILYIRFYFRLLHNSKKES